MKSAGITTLLMLIAAPSLEAGTVIQCTSSDAPEVVISVDDRVEFERKLSCISGRFVADMTPCAPEGGYGLSYPTGSVSLRAVVDRWQDYGDHHGGVAHFVATAKELHFAGGFMSIDGYTSDWSFTANRLSGEAELKTYDDARIETSIRYTCRAAAQKF